MHDKALVNNVSNLNNNLDYLGWELLLGMRTQIMGRDQNLLIDRMRALPQGLVMAYLDTEFVLHLGEAECVVTVRDAPPGMLTKFLESRQAATWSVVSAYNPYSQELSMEENQRRHQLLEELLTASRFDYYPAVGRSATGDWEEPSLLVLGLSYDMARALGTVFEQNAIVFGERGAVVEMVFCDR